MPEGIDIDDCETSVRILKDTLLHKSKGFTSPALIDLVCGPIENYHKQLLGDFASGQNDRIMSHYPKFCQTVLDAVFVEVGINEYHVCSRVGDKHVHTVNTDLAVCDCKGGKEVLWTPGHRREEIKLLGGNSTCIIRRRKSVIQ